MRAAGILLIASAGACGSAETTPARATTSRPSPAAARPLPGTVSNADEVANRMSPKFRECYQIGLWQNADQKGSVRLVIQIDAGGHPAKVTPAGGDGLDRLVLSCLVSVVRKESFAPPAGGSAIVTIPLNFGSDQK